MRHTCVKDNFFGHQQDKIAQYNRLDSGYVLSTGIIKRRNGRNYWFDWVNEKSDEEFVEIKNLDNCKKALKLINASRQICPICGKEFELAPRQRTELCPECYRNERKRRENERTNKWHKQKRRDIIEKK